MGHVQDLAGAQVAGNAATDLIDRISYRYRVEEFYPELVAVVEAGRLPADLVAVADGHDEAAILNFLTRLVAELDARRPWPDPALLQVDSAAWNSPGAARAIAWLDIPKPVLEAMLHGAFESVPEGELLVLRLRPGHLVALLAENRPEPDRFIVLLPDDDWSSAPDVIAYLADYTGLELETAGLDPVPGRSGGER